MLDVSSESIRVREVVRTRPKRQERSRVTERRVIEAATRLFLRDGYLVTTMAAIAKEAGVAVQTLYLGFGSKLGILSAALDVAIVGDDEPVPLLDRPWMREVVELSDGHHALELFVLQARQIIERVYPLFAVTQAAAAGEAGELLAENKRQRYRGVHTVTGYLRAKPGFADGLTVDHAADLIYALLSEEQYGLLVNERGWTPEAWQTWCFGILDSALFPSAEHDQLCGAY